MPEMRPLGHSLHPCAPKSPSEKPTIPLGYSNLGYSEFLKKERRAQDGQKGGSECKPAEYLHVRGLPKWRIGQQCFTYSDLLLKNEMTKM
jgi:hypothetical protein